MSITVHELDTCGHFQKHFMGIIYSLSKLSRTIHCMQAPKKYFHNELTYFATVISYECKMVICGQFQKHFMNVAYGCSKISCTINCMQAPMKYS
jgi:hypothetical protein